MDHEDILAEELATGRVKIVSWLKPEPIVLLQSDNVICYVHHGGANLFFEACKTGVTHVVLPQWWDTYDSANKAEYLGIGEYGSRTAAPHIKAEDFSQALTSALRPEPMAKARIIRELCAKEGRVVACEEITKLVRDIPRQETRR